MTDPGHCLTGFPRESPFQAVWTFDCEADARAWASAVESDSDDPDYRCVVVRRVVRARGQRVPLWLLLIP